MTTKGSIMKKDMSPSLPIFFILAVALALRLSGIHFGLPYNYHADEALEVHQALAYGTGDLNPHFFQLPPLVTHLLFPFYVLFYFAGHLFGFFPDADSFLEYFLANPTPFYLIARVVFGALLGTFSAWLVFLLGRRFFNLKVGLTAAWLLAVNFLHVRDCHYYYLDIPLLTILIGGMFFVLRIFEENKISNYLWGGFFVGMACAMKYNGVWLAVVLTAAHYLKLRGQKAGFVDYLFPRTLWLAAGISLLSFFLFNPFALIDFQFFIKEMQVLVSVEEGAPVWSHHLWYSLVNAVGIPILIISLGGILAGAILKEKKIWLLSLWVLSYYVLLTRASQPHDRYVLPIVPFLLIIAAWFLVKISEWLSIQSGLVFFLLVFVISLPNLSKSVLSDHLFLQKDTRTEALEKLAEVLPSGSKVALGEPYFFTPRFTRDPEQMAKLVEKLKMDGRLSGPKLKRYEKLMELARRQQSFYLYYLNDHPNNQTSYLSTQPQMPYDMDILKKEGIQYIILPQLLALPNARFEQSLSGETKKIAGFTPYKDKEITSAVEKRIRTGGASTWRELLMRRANGEIIDVYERR
ncbi:MAG: glycosyltransferase family 39 protein [Candidatus Omnitrophica bacterium]|nr:glycosyltransferase family 39 protein [Candidatus Omnitrophota bacterium]